MSHSAAPFESPSHIMTPGPTKGKQTLPLSQVSSSLTLALPCFRFSPGFPEGCTINTPEPETCAQILSAFPKSNKCVPNGYLNNKGGIGRVWRRASFPTSVWCTKGRGHGASGIAEPPTQGTSGSVAIVGPGGVISPCTIDKDCINTGMGRRYLVGVVE